MSNKNNVSKGFLVGIPPWIILGAVMILVPIFVFWAVQSISKQKEDATILLLEKGAALIRSFEAGTRTGMMGMHGGGFQFQRLLTETAQQPDVVYLIVTDMRGTVFAHSDPSEIGQTYGRDLNLERISRSQDIGWRQVVNHDGAEVFEVFRQFSPTQRSLPEGFHGRMLYKRGRRPPPIEMMPLPKPGQIIFVGLDMGPIETARMEDVRHTVIMAVILLLIGLAGIVSLFLAQAYRSARTSLTRIKAFSDTVVENMPIGLLTLDREGRVTSFNQTAEAVLGRSSGEVVGKKAHEMLPEQLWALIDERKSKHDIIERDVDCALGGGNIVPLEASVSSLFGDNGESLGEVLLFRDLTEVQELKREVERNRRLASIGRLAAGIAHEIRNPLSSIKGFATYFRERYRDVPEDQKTAEIMIQEVERLNRVIGQLLEFARPMKLNKKEANIHEVITYSLKMVQKQAQDRGIAISTNLSPEIVDVSIDTDRISQVLLNLYLNAIEAMDQGGVLHIDSSLDEESGTVTIVVSDTGAGIKREDLAHVFDPYFTTKQSGTGLGLAIVHRIIEAHRGEVRIESEPGTGTRVTIVLPFR
ncbi:MAG: PAS domain S-box protein [Deltaproteobacteria bacterium]|nr:PAS domain S-box protein [Deltaproteobacteria bacterium]